MGMSHQQIAHVWAQRSGRAVQGFNVYTSGDAIYSYGSHFCLARFVETTPRKGEPRTVVLYNSNSYSVSTSKHQSHVARAIPARYRVYRVPGANPNHLENLRHFEARAIEAFSKAKRARTYAALHEEDARRALDDASDYAADFGLKWKRPADVGELVAEAEARAKREAKARAKAAKERAKREAEQAAEMRQAYAEDFAAWQRGEGYNPPSIYRTDAAGSVYMRVVGEELQTSLGATVPLRHAVRVFQFVKLCRERGEGWKRNGRTIRVGHFQVDEITPSGDMVAGCHRFTWERLAEAAELAHVAAVEPSAEAVEVTSAEA